MRIFRSPATLLTLALPLLAGTPAVKTKAPEPAPLYTRVGGVYGIAEIADAWVDKLWDDPALLKNSDLKATRDRLTKAAVKFHLAIELCHAAGGPCNFEGKGGAPKGTDLHFGPDEWQVVRNALGEVLGARKISRTDADAILAILDGHIAEAAKIINDFSLG